MIDLHDIFNIPMLGQSTNSEKVNIHRNIYQNRFINECATKNFAKYSKFHNLAFILWEEEDLTFLINI